jgi:hypothetical protein
VSIGQRPTTPTRKLPVARVVDVKRPVRRTWTSFGRACCPTKRENLLRPDTGPVVRTLAKNGWRTGPERQLTMS